MHRLTRGRVFRLRVDMWDVEGQYWVAEYPEFRVASADQLYRLDLALSPADGDIQRTILLVCSMRLVIKFSKLRFLVLRMKRL